MAEPFDPYAPGSTERYAAMARIRADGGIEETAAGYFWALGHRSLQATLTPV